jgi:hypothetical protein
MIIMAKLAPHIGEGRGGKHYSRMQSSMPFKRDLALQNVPLSKQTFEMQPDIENEGVT